MAKKEVTAYSQKTFESIKHIDENGAESGMQESCRRH